MTMETLNITVRTFVVIETKYRPWDEMITIEGECGYTTAEGSELKRLGPNDILRIVRHDEKPAFIGAMLHGWWGEHLLAEDHDDGDPQLKYGPHGEAEYEARVIARGAYDTWLDNLELGSAAEQCDYCLYDDIRSLLPDTHEWGILDGWHSVYPKRLDDE